ncbi:enoyl-CoA hydratase-related protein [Solibacillus sp. FSL W8-0474]|uniref:enoyl-CoA hydratase/isomerase family protein n=1 Tax=Solibacillus sp. FSL W8-0474 TaxID=2975336 RepID=UPI0030FA666C
MNLETMTIEELDYGVHVVTINNPPANTLSAGIQRDLLQLLEEVENNQAFRAMVFKSANPKIFIAGADLGSMGSTKESVDIAESSKHVQDIFNRLEALKVPTIAAINGHALGGGCEFVLACDFRIMGQGTIGLTEASLGLLPGAGGTQRMTRLVGGAKARELMYLSKRLKAEQAAAIGLITEAVSPEEVEEKAISLATTLAQSAVGAIGLIKESILAAEELSLEQGLLVEREAFAKTFTTGEVEEGIRAFFEKRPPNFLKPVTNQ